MSSAFLGLGGTKLLQLGNHWQQNLGPFKQNQILWDDMEEELVLSSLLLLIDCRLPSSVDHSELHKPQRFA
jgi:hypothetical protein